MQRSLAAAASHLACHGGEGAAVVVAATRARTAQRHAAAAFGVELDNVVRGTVRRGGALRASLAIAPYETTTGDAVVAWPAA